MSEEEARSLRWCAKGLSIVKLERERKRERERQDVYKPGTYPSKPMKIRVLELTYASMIDGCAVNIKSSV